MTPFKPSREELADWELQSTCQAYGDCAPMPCLCCWHTPDHEHVGHLGPRCPNLHSPALGLVE